MSVSADNTRTLTVRANGLQSEFAHFMLYNGRMEMVAKSYGALSTAVPVGLYSVEMTFNEVVEKRMIRLADDHEVVFDMPDTYSAVAIRGYKTSHEYYSGPAGHFSKETTYDPAPGPRDGSLFLFFRFADHAQRIAANPGLRSIGAGFSILNADRRLLVRLSEKAIREDKESGWLAFHARLPAGNYYLHFKGRAKNSKIIGDAGEPAREIPLRIVQCRRSGAVELDDITWQTQVFMLFGRVNGTEGSSAEAVFSPLFQTLRINLASEQAGFNEGDIRNEITDGILQKFQNGISYIPEQQLADLADRKWQSPMQGLLAAYVYFNGGKRIHEDLFRRVAGNIRDVLRPDSPDANAILVLAAIHYCEKLPAVPFSDPPMFLSGTKTLIQSSALHKNLIVPGSIIEQTASRLYHDLVWTSYDPMPIAESAPAVNKNALSPSSSDFSRPDFTDFTLPEAAPDSRATSGSPTNRLPDEFQGSARSGGARKNSVRFTPQKAASAVPDSLKTLLRSPVAEDLLSFGEHMTQGRLSKLKKEARPKITVQDAARRLQLTPNIIMQTARALVAHQQDIIRLKKLKPRGVKIPASFTASNIETVKSLL